MSYLVLSDQSIYRISQSDLFIFIAFSYLSIHHQVLTCEDFSNINIQKEDARKEPVKEIKLVSALAGLKSRGSSCLCYASLAASAICRLKLIRQFTLDCMDGRLPSCRKNTFSAPTQHSTHKTVWQEL